MNWYFFKVFIPINIFFALGLFLAYFNIIDVNFFVLITAWIFMGPIGIGVGFHRLFSHRQFETYRPIEILLALLGTLSAYAPLLFWASNHRYHHKHSDTDLDPSSPEKFGFWESFLFYRLRTSALQKIDIDNYCSRRIIKDPVLRLINKNFVGINFFFGALLLLVSPGLFFNAYIFPLCLEHFRINVVSSLSHLPLPLNYKNHPTADNSFNNIILGYLSFGFAWHNNHHHDERAVNLHQKWWEFDIEGTIAQALTKKTISAHSADFLAQDHP